MNYLIYCLTLAPYASDLLYLLLQVREQNLQNGQIPPTLFETLEAEIIVLQLAFLVYLFAVLDDVLF